MTHNVQHDTSRAARHVLHWPIKKCGTTKLCGFSVIKRQIMRTITSMDPTQRNFQHGPVAHTVASMAYPPPPPPPPNAAGSHQQYLPAGTPYPPMPPMPPYSQAYPPMMQGYQHHQQYQGWPPYTPYFHPPPTAPMPNAMGPPHMASGMVGPPQMPVPTHQPLATPVEGPRARKHYVNSQREPGGNVSFNS